MHGLGNKLFDLLIGFFIQKLNGGEIYFVYNKGFNNKRIEPNIDDIFPNLRKDVKFIKEREMRELKEKYKESLFIANNRNISVLDDLKFNNRYKLVYFFNNFYLYKYIYDIFKILSKKIIENFEFNFNLISKKVLDISKTKYASIHIRYGDKLDISSKKEYKFNFLVYHPRFYIKMIKTFIKNNINVYIVTDDENIVQKFILNKVKQSDKVEILKIPSIEALYLLSHSKYLVLSMSTFSMFAALINKNLRKAFIASRPEEINKFKQGEEDLIEKINWKIYSKKKYILNYDVKLINEMIKFRIN